MMEAHKFYKMANQPTTTKGKNYYRESKCNLHVYLRDMLKKGLQEFLHIKCCGISCTPVSNFTHSYEDSRKALVTLNLQMK